MTRTLARSLPSILVSGVTRKVRSSGFPSTVRVNVNFSAVDSTTVPAKKASALFAEAGGSLVTDAGRWGKLVKKLQPKASKRRTRSNAPHFDSRALLHRFCGVDLTVIEGIELPKSKIGAAQ